MERTEKFQNMNIEINNPINTANQDANNISASKKAQNEEPISKLGQKFNEFIFTPIESFLLNKKMPYGFKFESEENILKSLELSKNKNIERENSKNINNSNSNKNNKNHNNANMSKIEGNNSEAYKVRIKCTSGFNKIKSSPGANLFYISKVLDAPSLAKIENKINNFEYKTFNECFDDIRKLWNYQFRNHAKDPKIYQNICRLSLLTENVYKELIAEKNTFNEKKEEISLIKKRTEKLKKDLEEINGNQKETSNKNIKVKNTASITKLSGMIKNLTKKQLKGIIPILSNEKTEQKSFEFDLEELPDDKFKKLEIYVVNCINENRNINHINKNINTHILNKKDNKNNGINNGFKMNGNINNNGIYKNNINNQNSFKKEENKKVDNSFSDSDSMSSNSSL